MESHPPRRPGRAEPLGPLGRAEQLLPVLAPGAHRRPHLERALEQALDAGSTRMVLLRGPRGAGRRTAVALWSRRRLRTGQHVVWVDVPESGTLDGDTLGRAVRARLAHVTGDPAGEGAISAESVAAALDAHETLLVVDRIGAASGPGLRYLDRVARRLRRGSIVALSALPLPAPVPAGHPWTADDSPRRPLPGRPRDAAGPPAARSELTLRDLAVRPDEVEAAAESLGTPVTRSQARLLVTVTAGWAPVVYQALGEVRRASAGGGVTDETIRSAAAACRAAYLRASLPDEAVDVLVEAALAPRFSRAELAATGLLDTLPGAGAFVDRLVATGLVLDDPAGPDDVLAVEPHARRALLDYARGRDGDELALRATKAARRRARAGDARGALLVALESGDPGLVRDLLHGTWTSILDGHDASLHDVLWGVVTSTPATHVPAELRAVLSVTRRSPGRHTVPGGRGAAGLPAPAQQHRPDGPEAGDPESPLTTFARVAGLRRAGRPDDALRAARRPLGADGGPDVARALVGLQAALAAAETGLLDDALRCAEAAYQAALGSGALPLAAAAAELAALVHALDSGVRAAADWSAEADALPEPPAWWRHAVGDPRALTAALVRLEHLDEDLPDAVLAAVRDAAGTDLWFAGLHVEATLAALRRQEEAAVDQLRDVLAQRGLTPTHGGAVADVRIPPLLALDLGRLYLALGRGTQAAVVAGALTTRVPAAVLLDGHVRLAQGQARDALLAVTAVGPGATTGARLQAHLVAAEALVTLAGGAASPSARADGDGRGAGTRKRGGGARRRDDGGPGSDGVRRELARVAALAQQAGGALPYWWASAAVLRRVTADAPAAVRERIEQVLRRRSEPPLVEFVTVPDRQLVVLHRLADGLTSAEVAKASFVSQNTVKTQIRELYRRLGVHDRTTALRRARELGLLDPMVRARLGADPASSPSRR